MTEVQPYSLGASEAELARLAAQAASIAKPTALFVASAGIAPGMRALDLGTGLGHVAFLLSKIVGPTGEVVGIDQAAPMLAVAEKRRVAAGAEKSISWRLTSVRAELGDRGVQARGRKPRDWHPAWASAARRRPD